MVSEEKRQGPEGRPVGLVLAGGRGVRLGGGDKPLRRLGSRTMLDMIVERLSPQCVAVWISANGDPSRFAPFNRPVLPDDPRDMGAGPLAGILAGLTALPPGGSLLTVPGDVPFLPGDLAGRLGAAVQPGWAAAARSGGRRHPAVALWPCESLATVRQQVRDRGVRRVETVLEAVGVTWVDWPADPADPFSNINTPEDLEAARGRVADVSP